MKMKVLLTGGAGFIGSNLAHRFSEKGADVIILDNFSRPGVLSNLKWLQSRHPHIGVVRADVRFDRDTLQSEVEKSDIVFHLAAQTAVTTSVTNPREDFEINAMGTFNVVEAVRLSKNKPILFYSSTNKVYGKMTDVKVVETEKRYEYKDLPTGIAETRSLDFYSPYGCSKGIGDQYVRDYARIYGLKTIVFRQSCIYGPRQFGIEDQGWIAWFTIASLQRKPLTIYGDGKQLRDVLYIDDLLNAFELAVTNIEKTQGHVYNIGGGPNNTLSLLELIALLEDLQGRKITYTFADWRPGDQRVYVSDISTAKKEFDWEPKVNPEQGVQRLFQWVRDNRAVSVCFRR